MRNDGSWVRARKIEVYDRSVILHPDCGQFIIHINGMTRPPMQRIALHWPDNLKFIPAAVHLNRDDSDARVIVMIVVEIGEL